MYVTVCEGEPRETRESSEEHAGPGHYAAIRDRCATERDNILDQGAEVVRSSAEAAQTLWGDWDDDVTRCPDFLSKVLSVSGLDLSDGSNVQVYRFFVPVFGVVKPKDYTRYLHIIRKRILNNNCFLKCLVIYKAFPEHGSGNVPEWI